MRSAFHDMMPLPTKRALTKFGQDVSTARRKRRFTLAMMVERTGVSLNTYRRIEKGDPSVAMGAYAMVLFALGFGNVLGDMIDRSRDNIGLQLEEERLPKRVRVRRTPAAS
jgi:transcriptional regulator with XRE-family HTH domain